MKKLYDLMLGNSDKILEAKTATGYMWRFYLFKAKVTPMVWDNRMYNYFEKCKESIKNLRVSDEKGNLLKAVCRDDVPWQRVCQGMSVVSPMGFSITFIIKIDDKEVSIKKDVPWTFREQRGYILSEVWAVIAEEYKDKLKDWNKLVTEYKKKAQGGPKERKNVSLSGNLKSTLREESITWRTLSQALSVLNPDSLSIKLESNGTDVLIKVR